MDKVYESVLYWDLLCHFYLALFLWAFRSWQSTPFGILALWPVLSTNYILQTTGQKKIKLSKVALNFCVASLRIQWPLKSVIGLLEVGSSLYGLENIFNGTPRSRPQNLQKTYYVRTLLGLSHNNAAPAVGLGKSSQANYEELM